MQPAQAPRYVIEIMDDYGNTDLGADAPKKKYLYRVTAIGFGPRTDIQAVIQMIYRDNN